MKPFKILPIFSLALLIGVFGCNSDDSTVNPDEGAIDAPKDSIPNPASDSKPDSEGHTVIFSDDFSTGDLSNTDGDAPVFDQ